MELIDRNKIDFKPIRVLNMDEHKYEITGMALFKDIEKIPTVKAIPLARIKEFYNEIVNINQIAILQKLNELIEEYEREEE